MDRSGGNMQTTNQQTSSKKTKKSLCTTQLFVDKGDHTMFCQLNNVHKHFNPTSQSKKKM